MCNLMQIKNDNYDSSIFQLRNLNINQNYFYSGAPYEVLIENKFNLFDNADEMTNIFIFFIENAKIDITSITITQNQFYYGFYTLFFKLKSSPKLTVNKLLL